MKRPWIIPAIITVVLICCVGLLAAGLGGGLYYLTNLIPSGTTQPFVLRDPTGTPKVIRPSAVATSGSRPQETLVDIPEDTLQTLKNTIVPINNLPDLARRLKGERDIPLTVPPPPAPLAVGTHESFWVINVDTNENFQISATLRYVTDHLYFWVQDEVAFNQADVKTLSETFENKIYPTDRDFFGSEWTPGVDGDVHLYILYASDLRSILGYFSPADEYHPLAYPYSNAHEMFLLNADRAPLNEDFTYGVLAHEFQHMIHWYRDRNEDTWMNEGFSELAALLNGYDGGGYDTAYARDPDLQLNDWPDGTGESIPHYGAAFLFLTYFLDRFGDQATQTLVGDPENGLVSIDKVLAELNERDSLTGGQISADDVFMDWVLTSYLNDETVSDGRYYYHNYPNAPQPSPTETISRCPRDPSTRDVHQYGVDYIRITCRGDYNLHFEGTLQVPVVPEDPHSGKYAFWSNRADGSDMTLTRTFDFRDYDGPITLSYWAWYDLEKDYDYLYLEASSDGENWQILTTPSCTVDNPSGNSYGCGYNGKTNGWKQEQVDLSQYAGQQVQIRFEYVTDAAVNGEGFLLDDVSIPEIGYSSNFEDGDGGWQGEGWVRIENVLPQSYRLALITHGKSTHVADIPLTVDNTADIPLQIGGDVDEAVLVVTGTNRFTRNKAAYRFSIQP
jgi:immune inhibitor A